MQRHFASAAPVSKESVHKSRRSRAQLALRRRSRARRKMIDGFAHDVRTPLAVIHEYLALLSDQQREGEHANRQIVDVIADRADDLNSAFGSLLDALNLDAGSLAPRRRRCKVASCVRGIQTGLERKAALRKGCLTFDISTDLPDVYCDVDQIGRVIQSLTTRAIKGSSGQGSVRVWAALGQQSEVRIGVTQRNPTDILGDSAATCDGGPQADGNTSALCQGLPDKLWVAREILRRNLSELELEKSGDQMSFSFGLPLMDHNEIVKRYLEKIVGWPDYRFAVSLATIHCVEPTDTQLTRELESLLGIFLRQRDLLVPREEGGWLVARPGNDPAMLRYIRRLEAMRDSVNQKRPRHPLPALRVNPLGTWRPLHGSTSLLSRLRTVLPPRCATT